MEEAKSLDILFIPALGYDAQFLRFGKESEEEENGKNGKNINSNL